MQSGTNMTQDAHWVCLCANVCTQLGQLHPSNSMTSHDCMSNCGWLVDCRQDRAHVLEELSAQEAELSKRAAALEERENQLKQQAEQLQSQSAQLSTDKQQLEAHQQQLQQAVEAAEKKAEVTSAECCLCCLLTFDVVAKLITNCSCC